MYYSDYKKYDVLNGCGLRHSLFVSGCTHHCKGCFNKKAWDFNYGKPFTEDFQNQIIQDVNNPNIHISGLSVLGGEPFDNVEGLLPFFQKYKQKCLNKDLWVWTGYSIEQLYEHDYKNKLLYYIDVLIDGKYVEELKDLTLKFRGSKNQRIILVNKSCYNIITD